MSHHVTEKPTDRIDKQIAGLKGWRGEMMTKLRKIINSADPGIKEDWKWETAVWVHSGNVCSIGAFKDHVKLNFFKGAALADPKRLFNSGLDAKTSRAIDFSERDRVNEAALKELVKAAIAQNTER